MSEQIGDLIAVLWEKDHRAADQAESADSGAVAAFLDVFFAKLAHPSAYQRMRAMVLIACNAKWDAAGCIDEKNSPVSGTYSGSEAHCCKMVHPAAT